MQTSDTTKNTVKHHRPWGYYIVLSDKPDHKVKTIVVHPDRRISLQLHKKRSEHWYIVSGNAVININDRTITLQAGSSVDIPREHTHRITNSGKENLVFIEIQTGEYFGEDDIERLEDDFGRE